MVSAHCGHWNDWQGQGAGTPRLELMSWSELRGIARQGIEIGAHTARHPDLTKASPAEAERELAECRSAIEQGVGAAAESFAYPYGAANDEVR